MKVGAWAALLLAGCLVTAGCAGVPGTGGTETRTPGDTSSQTPSPTRAAAPTDSPAEPDSPTASPSPTPIRNPWGTGVVYVGIDRTNVSGDRNVEPLVEAAVTYWNDNADSYGEYAVRFELRPDASLPHLVVDFRTDVECNGSTTAIGCAPILTADSRVSPNERPLIVAVETGYVNNTTRDVVIHEFGHVLGIRHGSPPTAIMQPKYDAVHQSAPNATERLFPWNNRTLAVYVEEENLAKGGDDTVREREIMEALAFYESDRDDGWIDDVTFERVDAREAADIVISATADPPCDGGSCRKIFGHDIDDDPALEYYTSAEIILYTGTPDEHYGWHTAYWLAVALGAHDAEDIPDDLRNGSRYGNWWEED